MATPSSRVQAQAVDVELGGNCIRCDITSLKCGGNYFFHSAIKLIKLLRQLSFFVGDKMWERPKLPNFRKKFSFCDKNEKNILKLWCIIDDAKSIHQAVAQKLGAVKKCWINIFRTQLFTVIILVLNSSFAAAATATTWQRCITFANVSWQYGSFQIFSARSKQYGIVSIRLRQTRIK